MKERDFIAEILLFERNKNSKIVEKLLDKIDTVLSSYDEFMEEIFSDIFYELYLNEDQKTYLEIAVDLDISASKVYDVKVKITTYVRKLIKQNAEFKVFKKYL